MGDSSNLVAVGTHLYVACENEVWREGIVDQISGGEVVVKCENGEKVTLKKGTLYYPRSTDVVNTPSGFPDDLCNLTHLHEASVLHSLDKRFKCDDIYTFTGKILVAVNPFKTIQGLYSEENIIRFLQDDNLRSPHVFSIAKQAYVGMTQDSKSQTILISGESGAGKTESTKFALKFLATAGAENMNKRSPVELRVLESNPLLETFGNASTLRNANSSRFGKFIELQFQKLSPIKSQLCGAKIETYLLEKIRVCKQLVGERNYHIFHQLHEAGKKGAVYKFPQLPRYQDREPWEFDVSMLQGDFRILPENKSPQWDAEFFEETLAAMQTIGMSKEDVEVVFSLVTAVLHLCNIEFMPSKEHGDGAAVSNTEAAHAAKVVELLNVDSGALLNALLCRTIKTAHEMYTKPLRMEEACDIRDAIAKNIYMIIFDYIVQRANTSIGYVDDDSLFVCGVLDIFGFECFKENSFEQLCINFTNETLQHYFNNFVFKCEEKLYTKEGVKWDPLDFPDNSDCIELFKSKPNGLFVMIDEECHVPGGKDQSLVDKIVKRHTNHPRFQPVKTDRSSFIINHFAGSVKYSIEGFLEKNKDQLSNDAVNFIKSTRNESMKQIFESYYDKQAAAASTSKRQRTISTQFSGQLDSLMAKISKTEPHFIRCIKPNDQAKPLIFNRNNVNLQLRCSGMLQVVQVSRAGYPVRWSHQDLFTTLQWILGQSVKDSALAISDLKKRSVFIVEHLAKTHKTIDEKSVAIGSNLVFLKNAPFEELHRTILLLKNKSATKVQAYFRSKVERRRYLHSLHLLHFLQCYLRFKVHKIKEQRERRNAAIVTIQSAFRMYLERRVLLHLSGRLERLQSQWRCITSRVMTKQRRLNAMVTKIQSAWKGFVCRRHYLALLDATIKAQLRWRGILARKQLRSLRMEAKSLGTMIQKAQDLQQRLHEEVALREDAEAKVLQLSAKSSNLQETVDELKAKLEALEKEHKELQEKLAEAEANSKRYQEDLRKLKEFLSNEAMQNRGAVAATAADKGDRPARALADVAPSCFDESPRTYGEITCDVVLCGPSGCGKSKLVDAALARLGLELPTRRSVESSSVFTPQVLTIPQPTGGTLTVCEVPGLHLESNRARRLYRNANLIAIFYDPSNNKSFDHTLQFVRSLTLSISTRATSLCLCQNDAVLQDKNKIVTCDVEAAQKFATENELVFLRVSDFCEFLQQVSSSVEAKRNIKLAFAGKGYGLGQQKGRPGHARAQPQRGALSVFYEKFRDFWDNINYKTEQPKLLRPTLVVRPGTKIPSLSLRRVAAITEHTVAVTCVAFRPEHAEEDSVILAVGRRDGTINIYRCFRTATERLVLSGMKLDETGARQVDDEVVMAEPMTLSLHSKAITCMSFSKVNHDELVTTSVDATIRAWNIATGQLIKVFNDSVPGLAVIFHPVEPSVFISSNSSPMLRLIDYNKGSVLQRIKTKSELRTLCFDDTRFSCIAGSERGTVAIYEAQDNLHLKLSVSKQISRGPVTCVNFVPAKSPTQTPCIIANVCSGNITVLNCIYDVHTGKICEVSYRYSVNNSHVALPLRSCISSFGGGWCISGSEDRSLLIFNLQDENMPYNITYHAGPVVAVAVNQLDTLLATSDSRGVVALWRRALVVSSD